MSDFEIKLPSFEGPFDLLLFFIERDELDIADIPIAEITDGFLAYIHQMEHLNIEVASEFILFAATLMRIKAKMLLPRPVISDTGEELDPREDLVRHLLEYKRIKEVAAQLSAMEDGMMARFARQGVEEQLRELMMDAEEQSPLTNLTLTSVAVAFQKALLHYSARGQVANHVVFAVPYNIADQKAVVAAAVALAVKVTFLDLVKQCADRLQVVYTFMAILEMLNEHAIALVLGEGANEFYLERMSLNAIAASEA